MLIKLYKVFVVGTECSRAYHLACSYVRNLEGVIPLPGLAFERIECFPASLVNLFVTFFYRTFLGESLPVIPRADWKAFSIFPISSRKSGCEADMLEKP